jgi:hypothetical protein
MLIVFVSSELFNVAHRAFHQCGVQRAQLCLVGYGAFHAATLLSFAYFANTTNPPLGLRTLRMRSSPVFSSCFTGFAGLCFFRLVIISRFQCSPVLVPGFVQRVEAARTYCCMPVSVVGRHVSPELGSHRYREAERHVLVEVTICPEAFEHGALSWCYFIHVVSAFGWRPVGFRCLVWLFLLRSRPLDVHRIA